MTNQTDVLQAQYGDPSAYERLYRLNRQSVFWLCLRVTKNEADAEDLTQQAFLQAFLHLSSFRRDCNFRTWLWRIAMNEALMHLRRRRTSEISLEDLSEPDASVASQGRSHNPVVLKRILAWQIMKTVPEHSRTLLILRHFAGCTQQELTEWMGLPLGTTKAQLSRARRALRKAFSAKLRIS